MFKDFRENLKSNQQKNPTTKEETDSLFRHGDVTKAIKACKRHGYKLSEFQTAIEFGAKKLILSHRVGELLSFIHNTGVNVQYDITCLLRMIFDNQDYHGFLKQAHRFQKFQGLENEINYAIQKLVEKRQLHDAEAWKRKFEALQVK